jgi:autotransporter-associated beta strand protein
MQGNLWRITMAAVIVLGMAGASPAATLYWAGAVDTDFNDSDNWDTAADLTGGVPVAPPGTGDTAVIYSRVNQPTVTLNTVVQNLVFDTARNASGGGSITLDISNSTILSIEDGGEIRLLDGGDHPATIGSGAGGSDVRFGASGSIINEDTGGGGADLIFRTPVARASAVPTTVYVDSATDGDDLIVAHNILADIALVKNGAGTVRLQGDNEHASTTINAGTLVLEHVDAFGAGDITMAGGVLDLGIAINEANWDPAITVTGDAAINAREGLPYLCEIDRPITVTGGKTLTFTGDGRLYLRGGIHESGAGANVVVDFAALEDDLILNRTACTYTGTTSVQSGTIRCNAANMLAPSSPITLADSASAGLTLSIATQTIGGLAGGGGNGGNVVFDSTGTLTITQEGDTTYGGVISGLGGITKDGAGTLILSGTNTYTGSTDINAGTLVLGHVDAFGAGDITMTGGVLDLGIAIDEANWDPAITVTGDAAINAREGLPYLCEIDRPITVTGGKTLTFTGDGRLYLRGGIHESGAGANVVVDFAALEDDLILNRTACTYTGTTSVQSGTIRCNAANMLAPSSPITLADSASAGLTLSIATQTIGGLAGGGGNGGNVVFDSTGTLTITQEGDTTYGGVISGLGGITKDGAGTLILSGTNTYMGRTTISDGTLRIESSTALGADSGDTVIENAGPGVLELAGGITIPAGESIIAKSDGASSTIVNASGDNTILGDITLSANKCTVKATAGRLALNGVVGGAQELIKSGGGYLVFGGANTYDGATTVNAGSLLVNAVMGDANDGGLTVKNGATLAGKGTVKSDVIVEDGGTVSPGDGGFGTLTVASGTASGGNVEFQGASKLLVEITDPSFDALDIGGNLVLPVNSAIIAMNGGYDLAGSYQVVSVTRTYDPTGGREFQNSDDDVTVTSTADTGVELSGSTSSEPVPTLGEWGVILFAMLLAGYALRRLRADRCAD